MGGSLAGLSAMVKDDRVLKAAHTADVLNILKACPDYVFKACPVFDLTIHAVHIRNQTMYDEFCEKGFCPFSKT
jgi:hypothetical protein